MTKIHIGLLALSLLLGACSLRPGEHQVVLQFDLSKSPGFSPLTTAVHNVAPSSAQSFNCYFFNIIGKDIPPAAGFKESGSFRYEDVVNRYLGGQPEHYCSYPGIYSEPILPSAGEITASLALRSGTNRVVQVIGVVDPSGKFCSARDILSAESHDAELYNLGNTTLPDINQSMTLSIPKTFPEGEGAALAESRAKKRVDKECGYAPKIPVAGAAEAFEIADLTQTTKTLGITDPDNDLKTCTVTYLGGVTNASCACSGAACSVTFDTGSYCASGSGIMSFTITDATEKAVNHTVAIQLNNGAKKACLSLVPNFGSDPNLTNDLLTPGGRPAFSHAVFNSDLYFAGLNSVGRTKLFHKGSVDAVASALTSPNGAAVDDDPGSIVEFAGNRYYLASFNAGSSKGIFRVGESSPIVIPDGTIGGSDGSPDSGRVYYTTNTVFRDYLQVSNGKLYFFGQFSVNRYVISWDGSTFVNHGSCGSAVLFKVSDDKIFCYSSSALFTNTNTTTPVPLLTSVSLLYGISAANPNFFIQKSGANSGVLYYFSSSPNALVTRTFTNTSISSEVIVPNTSSGTSPFLTQSGRVFFSDAESPGGSNNFEVFTLDTSGGAPTRLQVSGFPAGISTQTPHSFFEDGNYVYFVYGEPNLGATASTRHIYRIDTSAAVLSAVDMIAAAAPGFYSATDFTRVGNYIYFVGATHDDNPTHYRKVFRFLASSPVPLTLEQMGDSNSAIADPDNNPAELLPYQGKLFFGAKNSQGNYKLFHY